MTKRRCSINLARVEASMRYSLRSKRAAMVHTLAKVTAALHTMKQEWLTLDRVQLLDIFQQTGMLQPIHAPGAGDNAGVR